MEKNIWLDKLREEDRDTVFSMTSDPEIVKYMRFDTHEKPEEAITAFSYELQTAKNR